MEKKINGYSISIEWKNTPDGLTSFKKEILYMPDENTEITEAHNSDELRDLTEKELNEIMTELENKQKIEDSYPLLNIRKSALQ